MRTVLRENRRAAVGEVVAVDRGEHEIFPAEVAHGFGDAQRFEPVDFAAWAPRLDVAEPAAARARVAQDHDRRRAGAPALADVRTHRFLADRVQLAARALSRATARMSRRGQSAPLATAACARGGRSSVTGFGEVDHRDAPSSVRSTCAGSKVMANVAASAFRARASPRRTSRGGRVSRSRRGDSAFGDSARRDQAIVVERGTGVERDPVQRGHLFHRQTDRADLIASDVDAAVCAPALGASTPNAAQVLIAASSSAVTSGTTSRKRGNLKIG